MEDLNQEYAGFWNVLKYLSNGKPRTWTEIKANADLSQVTLSKRLKKLEKLGVVTRKIIPAFPPRTSYELNKNHRDYALIKWLESASNVLKIRDKLTASLIVLSATATIINEETKLTLDDLMERLEYTIISDLHEILSIPLEKHPSHLVPITTTLITMHIMHMFWTIYECLTVSEERRLEAIDILSHKIKKKESSLERGEEIIAKALSSLKR